MIKFAPHRFQGIADRSNVECRRQSAAIPSFEILRFAVKARTGIKAADLIEMETLTCVVSCEGSEVYDLVLTQPIMVNLEPVNGYERKLTLNGER
jgi:hypothetical protein